MVEKIREMWPIKGKLPNLNIALKEERKLLKQFFHFTKINWLLRDRRCARHWGISGKQNRYCPCLHSTYSLVNTLSLEDLLAGTK